MDAGTLRDPSEGGLSPPQREAIYATDKAESIITRNETLSRRLPATLATSRLPDKLPQDRGEYQNLCRQHLPHVTQTQLIRSDTFGEQMRPVQSSAFCCMDAVIIETRPSHSGWTGRVFPADSVWGHMVPAPGARRCALWTLHLRRQVEQMGPKVRTVFLPLR